MAQPKFRTPYGECPAFPEKHVKSDVMIAPDLGYSPGAIATSQSERRRGATYHDSDYAHPAQPEHPTPSPTPSPEPAPTPAPEPVND